MHITPVIPDGYNGPVKQLTCRICKHIFYLTHADYDQLAEVSYCHECSLIIAEELEKNQVARSSISPKQAAVPASHTPEPAFASVRRPREPAFVSTQPSVRVPQPRIIDRDKMTVAQLLEEAKLLDKTWRYKEALASYGQALQLDPSASEPEWGKDYISTHIFHREPQKRADSPRKHALDREMIAKPCRSARDYYDFRKHSTPSIWPSAWMLTRVLPTGRKPAC